MTKIKVLSAEEFSGMSVTPDADVYENKGYNSIDRLSQKAVNELKQYFNSTQSSRGGRNLGKLLFYRLVKGGNVSIVAKILENVKATDPYLYRVVLLGEAEVKRQATRQNCGYNVIKSLISILVYLLVLLPINVVLTPIFYTVLSATHNRPGQCGVSPDIKLPLLFAVLSKNVDLVRIFSELQLDILKASDSVGCNVFHYLADLSQHDSRLANSCFDVLFRVFGSNDVRNVLLKDKNFNGLSGLELAVAIGSPLYFTKVLETEGILKETKLVQTSDQIYLGSNLEAIFDGPEIMKNTQQSAYILSHYDVSMYERGDVLQAHNFLLSLISARDFLDMSDEEIDSFKKCSLLKAWIKSKIEINCLISFSNCAINASFWTVLCMYIYTSSTFDEKEYLLTTYWMFFDQVAIASYQQANDTICPNSGYNSISDNSTSVICKMSEVCGRDVLSKFLSDDGKKTLQFAAKISLINILMSACVLMADVTFRVVFMGIQMLVRDGDGNLSLSVKLRRLFKRRIPISYVSRQLSVLSCFFVIMNTLLRTAVGQLNVSSGFSAAIKVLLMSQMKATLVLAALFRVLAIIYFSRLNSAGGHFVISMCKMGKLLRQFISVFMLLSSLITVVFQYVVSDPKCPMNKVYPFNDMTAAIFGTFRMMVGDNTLPDPMSMEVAVTYVVYVVLANIVMLSLLTGLAGSVADRVVSRDLKDLILTVERLEECIDVESNLLFLTYPFRKVVHRWRYSRALSTNVIVKPKRNGDQFQVFIEVEQLPTASDSNGLQYQRDSY